MGGGGLFRHLHVPFRKVGKTNARALADNNLVELAAVQTVDQDLPGSQDNCQNVKKHN